MMGAAAIKGASPRSANKDPSSFDYVRLTWIDLDGRGRGRTVPKLGGDWSKGTTGNLEAIGAGTSSRSVLFWPDVTSLHPLPWVSASNVTIGEMFCELRETSGKSQVSPCSRTLAKDQLKKLHEFGYTLYSGFEVEFTLKDAKTKLPVFKAIGPDSHMSQDIFTTQQDVMFAVERELSDVNVHVDTLQTEFCDGQFEITYKPCIDLFSADACILSTSAIKSISEQHGLNASFDAIMPDGGAMNALHFNHSLLAQNTGTSVFWDPKAVNNLSDIALYWIGGILKHTPALIALSAQTPDCYKRYDQHNHPSTPNWNFDDRSCSLRVKNWSQSECYIENRLASGKANPYLVLASTVAAGMDGIINKIKYPPNQQNLPFIPMTLPDALTELQRDEVLVNALGADFTHKYINHLKTVNNIDII